MVSASASYFNATGSSLERFVFTQSRRALSPPLQVHKKQTDEVFIGAKKGATLVASPGSSASAGSKLGWDGESARPMNSFIYDHFPPI